MNNNRKHTVMYSVGLCGIALALAFIVSPNNNNNSAMAQQNTTTMTANKPYPMSPSFGTQNQNWTGSISLFSPILDAFKSKIHTTLNDATTSAISAVGGGPNSSAVAAFIHPERGFLVYHVLVLDSSNNIHRVIIDPGNGKVLSNQPMSLMDMMFMMHHSMGMRGMMMGGGGPGMMMGTPQGMMMGPNDMMMDHGGMGMGGMMQHSMMGSQDRGAWP